MLRKLGLGAVAVAALVCFASTSQAGIYNFDVILTGPAESPPVASPGTGVGTVVYNDVAHTLALNVTFSGLVGTTTVSHIHAPTPAPLTLTAGVATTTPTFAGFPAGVTSGSYSNTLDLTLASSYNPSFITANGGTTASAEIALANAMTGLRSYWNIHSTFSPSGEIRGFLVPEPASAVAVAAAFGLLGLRRRRTV